VYCRHELHNTNCVHSYDGAYCRHVTPGVENRDSSVGIVTGYRVPVPLYPSASTAVYCRHELHSTDCVHSYDGAYCRHVTPGVENRDSSVGIVTGYRVPVPLYPSSSTALYCRHELHSTDCVHSYDGAYCRHVTPGVGNRDSSVGTVTGYGPDGQDARFYLVNSVHTDPGATQAPILWVPGTVSQVMKRQGLKLTTHLRLMPRSGRVELYLHCSTYVHGIVLK
jgi:hypothetical protein